MSSKAMALVQRHTIHTIKAILQEFIFDPPHVGTALRLPHYTVPKPRFPCRSYSFRPLQPGNQSRPNSQIHRYLSLICFLCGLVGFQYEIPGVYMSSAEWGGEGMAPPLPRYCRRATRREWGLFALVHSSSPMIVRLSN